MKKCRVEIDHLEHYNKENTESNITDALTKILPVERKELLLGRFLFKVERKNATDKHNK